MQLTGRGKTPEEREKILRKLSGIKEQPKKKEKEKKPAKHAAKVHAVGAGAEHGGKQASGKAEVKPLAKAKEALTRPGARAVAAKAHARHVSAAKKKHHR